MVENLDINVKVTNKSECIFKNTLKNEGNNLNSLISNLKSMQQKVNEVLTDLVQVEQSLNQGKNLGDNDESDDDDDSDEEENSKPKKCKYYR
ncbi:uncharacterized protein LOC100114728 isoform X2 [Nasonia vitripennis]|uniref:Uncharacterized protein n=1 Tax=Nasonia vitripennis TaxID=7425 RepID=A0A7M7TD72_NASVI|nr:uncharacterized protein LOC100114728 isoform X2 [Nasonia vitripennis]